MAERVERLTAVAGRCAAAAVTVCLVFSMLRLVARPYPLELLSHFQLQYLIGAVAGTLILAGLRRWRWASVGVAAVVVAGAAVLPWHLSGSSGGAWATPAAPGGGGRTALRLFHANVLASNPHADLVLAAIEQADPDVIVLQEITDRWLADLEALGRTYPHRVTGTREDHFGIAVFSRIPMNHQRVLSLGDAAHPSVSCTLTVGGTEISLLASHPTPPVPLRRFRTRNAQLEAVGEFLAHTPRPLIVVGDLNASMWTPWLRELQDHAGLVNARLGHGVLPSWPTVLPAALRIPIDHCLHSPTLAVASCRLGPHTGSDHLPLVVDFLVPPALEQ